MKATTTIDKTLGGLSESDQLTAMAVGIVFERAASLPKADRDDLFELFQCLSTAEGPEEVRDIKRTMLEILTQSPPAAEPMTPADDEPMTRGLKKWTEHVGKTIRELREQAGMTQTQLAEEAGLTQSHVSRLEKAEHSATHLTLQKIARALGVDVGKLDPCVD